LRILGLKAAGKDVEPGGTVRLGGVGPDARHHVQPPGSTLAEEIAAAEAAAQAGRRRSQFLLQCHRHPDVRCATDGCANEPRRRDPDHDVGCAIQLDLAADRGRRSRQPVLPEAI
jgi:hypothetical protein